MAQLDRYILRQTLTAFLFFCLILAGVIWLTQAVRLIDTVLSSGQSIFVLFEFSLLVLPRVLSMVVPLSGFAAAIYIVNKLYSEAELVVMMTAGQSPLALARPLIWFGLLIAALTLVITNFLAPLGELRLEQNRAAIRSELANALIREGVFIHPTDALTIFIRRAREDGQMEGLFLHDGRDPTTPVTYSAEKAVLLRDGDEARLVMNNGVALTFSVANRILARVRFQDFTFDLSDLVARDGSGPDRASNMMTWQLLFPDADVRALERYDRGTFLATGHERIVFGVHAALLPVLAIAVMLTGGYQRRGFGRRVVMAVLAGVLLITAGLAVKGLVTGEPALWPVSYAPAVLALIGTAYLLRRAAGPVRAPRVVTS
ncbi:LptF/LptG family permease [Oceanibium sediminis]|uniref:LptF/LptG family permease n=1 Tax=Oceanibium sediminis TaxID=2026339 RepID=UPI000DD4DBEC|nr:LptF/LptG family permease [Oceanibium sediminis]